MLVRQSAVSLASRGLKVFRLKRGTKNHFIDLNWAGEGSTNDPLAAFDKFDADCNIGVRTDGHIAVDVDAHKGGLEWLASFGTLPETFTVRTPNGGLHLYFKAPQGVEFSGSVEKIAKGIDIRARGNYVVGPASICGDRSYVIECAAPIAPAPARLIERVQAAPQKTDGTKAICELDTSATIKSARALLLSPATPVAIEGQGGDNTTFWVACEVIDLGISPETCFDLMWQHWNDRCVPPWDPEGLQKKVDNALTYRRSAVR